jgi:hypothetical protein
MSFVMLKVGIHLFHFKENVNLEDTERDEKIILRWIIGREVVRMGDG